MFSLRSGLVPGVFLALSLGLSPRPAAGQCPARTTINDTLYNADGTLADGRVVISWPTLQIGACQVVAGQASVTVTAGVFSVQLYPNNAAVPAGTSYRAIYYLKSGRVTTEYWVVPASATPVALAAVRSASVPIPTVMFSESQVTNLVADLAKKVELPSPCPSGRYLQSNGSATPPQVACVTGSGGGSQHQLNATNLAANDPVNFQDSSTLAFSNPSAGNVQAAVKDSSIGAAKLAVAAPTAAQLSGLDDDNIATSALSPNRISGTAVLQSRAVNTSAPLSGGGTLAADLALSCPACVTSAAALTSNGVVLGQGAQAAAATAAGAANEIFRVPAGGGAPVFGAVNLSAGAAVSGQLAVARGGTGADLSATGGANQFVKQSSAGGAFSVGAIADADVPDSITLANLTQITNRAISDTTGTLDLGRGGTNQASWTASRCVQVNSAGTTLESAATACGAGGADTVALSFSTDASTSNNPADNGVSYQGSYRTFQTSDADNQQRALCPFTGTLTHVYLVVQVDGTLGSAENVTVTLRKNGADTSITGTMLWNVKNVAVLEMTGSASVTKGDMLSLKTAYPSWATNPTTVRVTGWGIRATVP